MTGMYRRVAVETSVNTASPHQLIKLLLDGFFDAVASARGAIRAGDLELKAKAFHRAIGIVDEGLKASLDTRVGGELADNLSNLYAYISLRLAQANLRNDEALLDDHLAHGESEGRVAAPLHGHVEVHMAVARRNVG